MRVSCFLLACACGAVRLPPLASCATAMRYRPPLAFARARPVTLLADPGMLLGEVPMALASAADAAVQAADAMSEQGVLDSLGQDLFVFLVSSVVVVPLSRALGITPVLGFLALSYYITLHYITLHDITLRRPVPRGALLRCALLVRRADDRRRAAAARPPLLHHVVGLRVCVHVMY